MKFDLISAVQRARQAATTAGTASVRWIGATRFCRWIKRTQLGRWFSNVPARWFSNVPAGDRRWLIRTAAIGLVAWLVLAIWKQDIVEGLDFTVGFITAGIAALVWVRAMERRRTESLPNRLTVHFVNPTTLEDGTNSFEFVITVWDLPLDSPASIRELAQSGGRQAYDGFLPFSPHRISLDRQTLQDKDGSPFNNYVACYTLTGPVYDSKPTTDRQTTGNQQGTAPITAPEPPRSIYRVLFPDESDATIDLSPISSIITPDAGQNSGEQSTPTPTEARPFSTCTMISTQRPNSPIASRTDPLLIPLDTWREQHLDQ